MKNVKLKLGMKNEECRSSNMWHTCCKCGKDISPQLMVAHFETFKTNPFWSCGEFHRSEIAWRVSGWSHLNCK